MENSEIKLQTLLRNAGLGSRRAVDDFVAQGLVTVNGDKANLGQRVSKGDKVKYKGRLITVKIPKKDPTYVLAYNKPVGELCTRKDEKGRPTVFANLPPLKIGRWISVGRLDLNSTGLLLFTNSGELANRLMHPSYTIEREYLVRVHGKLNLEQISKLTSGIKDEGELLKFASIRPHVIKEQKGKHDLVNNWYKVKLATGKNREVRRLFAAVDCKVNRLIRTK